MKDQVGLIRGRTTQNLDSAIEEMEPTSRQTNFFTGVAGLDRMTTK